MDRVATRPVRALPGSRSPARATAGKPLRGTDPALIKGVLRLIKAGGSGTWFKSFSPFDGSQKLRSFFLVKQFPCKADPRSTVLLLQTEPTRAYLAGLVQQGAPFVVGTIPLGS